MGGFDTALLWSGAAGAALIALFTIGYTEIREARQGARERAGLSRLLADEVERNEERVEIMLPGAETAAMHRELLRVNVKNPPAVDVWLETRGRLAQRLVPDDFDTVASYYHTLYGLALDLEAASSRVNFSVRPIPKSEDGWTDRTAAVKRLLEQRAALGMREKWLGF